jgi:hypothetical protein
LRRLIASAAWRAAWPRRPEPAIASGSAAGAPAPTQHLQCAGFLVRHAAALSADASARRKPLRGRHDLILSAHDGARFNRFRRSAGRQCPESEV